MEVTLSIIIFACVIKPHYDIFRYSIQCILCIGIIILFAPVLVFEMLLLSINFCAVKL